MFRLILNPQTEAKVFYLPSDKRVYITSDCSCQPLISEEEPSTSHLLIETGKEWRAYNKNDPLATLNGEFFKEKKLCHLDILIAGGCTFLFEDEDKSIETAKATADFAKWAVSAPAKDDFDKQVLFYQEQDLEKALKELEEKTLAFTEEELYASLPPLASNEEIEQLIKDATALEWEEMQLLQKANKSKDLLGLPNTEQTANQEQIPYSPYHTVSEDTVDSTALDGEDEETEDQPNPNEEESIEEESSSSADGQADFQKKPLFFKKTWRWWGTIALFALLVFFLFLGSFISHLQEKRQEQEIQAAQSVADIAMALNYAHINGIKPKGHSWSDPSFIKKNLASILSKRYPILGNMDAQGRLDNSSYLLRIYTTNDLSHFVVIAQPNANLLQWVAPNPAIVVDSNEMELRKLSDVKELNRLLVKPQALEEEGGKALSDLISAAPTIPLADLATRYGKLGFVPPRSLMMLDPEARDKIYNAPRYFLFSQQVIERALASFHTPPLASRAAVIEELKSLEKLSHLVLYNTESYEMTRQAQDALAKLLPDNRFMFGYLRIDAGGKLLHSQLLLRSDRESAEQTSHPKTTANLPSGQELYTASLDASPGALQPEIASLSNAFPEKGSLQEKVKEIKNERSQRLAFITEPYIELLQSYTTRYDPLLQEMTEEMLNRLSQEEKLLQVEQRVRIEKLFREYEHEPMELLLKTLAENHLDYSPLEDHKKEDEQMHGEKIELIAQSLEKIADAEDLVELQTRVHSASKMLCWSYLSNTEQLIFYQRQLADQVLEQLRIKLLTSAAFLPPSLFSHDLDGVLSELFKDARLNHDPEIQKYFAEELDKVKLEQHGLNNLPILGK